MNHFEQLKKKKQRVLNWTKHELPEGKNKRWDSTIS